jgi:hypothetical protein
MSYQDFIENCNHVLLEMVGSTPSLAGTWDDRISSQLLHLGIARDHRVPCFGLAYGFFPDTAFFGWAVNKFLGSDCWFSTLKGRLNARQEELAALADDSELVGEVIAGESESEIITGEADTDVAVYFSRSTRDYYGQVSEDYANDYSASCLRTARAGISCHVVTDVPEFGAIRCLVLSSAACLSPEERHRLETFMAAGGTVIATGPAGHYDERANPVRTPWLSEFGITTKLDEPSRPEDSRLTRTMRNRSKSQNAVFWNQRSKPTRTAGIPFLREKEIDLATRTNHPKGRHGCRRRIPSRSGPV